MAKSEVIRVVPLSPEDYQRFRATSILHRDITDAIYEILERAAAKRMEDQTDMWVQVRALASVTKDEDVEINWIQKAIIVRKAKE